MEKENGFVKAKIDIATVGLKLDMIDGKISDFIRVQEDFNHTINQRLGLVELTLERWKGKLIGGIAVGSLLFTIISLLIKFL